MSCYENRCDACPGCGNCLRCDGMDCDCPEDRGPADVAPEGVRPDFSISSNAAPAAPEGSGR